MQLLAPARLRMQRGPESSHSVGAGLTSANSTPLQWLHPAGPLYEPALQQFGRSSCPAHGNILGMWPACVPAPWTETEATTRGPGQYQAHCLVLKKVETSLGRNQSSMAAPLPLTGTETGSTHELAIQHPV